MRTLVIILAQGSQTRLAGLPVAKQLLPLPACDETPILSRTLTQLLHCGVSPSADSIRLVTWLPTIESLLRDRHLPFCPDLVSLIEPGNSSLKGFSFTLDRLRGELAFFDRFVCLLGDVVYSWSCLNAILAPLTTGIRFVGTSDLSNDAGELWGFAWNKGGAGDLYSSLYHALLSHPKFTAYQPGQMRRLLWAVSAGALQVPREYEYVAVDDYTRDIDVPEHLDLLPTLSQAAADDDTRHGVLWGAP